MKFGEICGQLNVSEKLINSVQNNRISHAYLFIGPEGNGKLALALAFAQYICCEHREKGDSCGNCPSCLKYQKLIHPDLHFVFPVAKVLREKTNPVSDDFIRSWRECLLDDPYMNQSRWYETIGVENKQGVITIWESKVILKKLGFKSYESDYKIMIIWLPEKMNQSSANKILKIIEEPPSKTVFILVSENSEQIIPTIISRTQIIKIPRIENELLWQCFKERYSLELNKKEEFIHLADGNYIKAKEIVEKKKEHQEYFDLFVELMRKSFNNKIPELFQLVERLNLLGREKQKSFILYTIRMIRENYIKNILPDGGSKLTYLSNQEEDFSLKFHKFIHKRNINELIKELNLAYRHIEQNANTKILFMDLALKLHRILIIK